MGLLTEIPQLTLLLAAFVAVFAGFVKGAVGFGMPLIMISGLATMLPAEQALAALIVPTVVTNGYQAFRQGILAAWQAVGKFRVFLIALLICLTLSAQLVTVLSQAALFILIGVPVVAFCLMQLSGWKPMLHPEHRKRDESLIGAFAGLSGGLSGVWGPPTIAYLTAIDTPKSEQMRVQGVIYGVGAIALFAAHIKSGVLNAHTFPMSISMLFPALIGMALGGVFHDRMPQATFKRVTLIVLTVAGLNLIRRGLWG
ncbi:sulfite exporter TauE/SafE family protein [Aliiroseovarius sp. F47248L]|uniref:sulfite exporter TauE/SafE family protein n=1 Tax=Aliiroseovarius sp. F47248L TaxID=2926420 RepID=UPI001FF3AD5B|nr:sulfite exporter TauE/SafE family protein [Aliiroseovarius sp. F47248L]MCK0140454.1 sulfite exporter TauE/SafE family protein [Aliiroseovarius sp. F47248L]